MPEGPEPFLAIDAKDPNARVKCVSPESSPPFETRTLFLKQVETTDLNELSRGVFEFFGGFFDRWAQERGHHAQQTARWLSAMAPDAGQFDVRPEGAPIRRYAGDWLLPRHCYYTICHSLNGADDRTMERELLAYQEPAVKGLGDCRGPDGDLRRRRPGKGGLR